MISDGFDEVIIDEDLLKVVACPICPARPKLALVGHNLICSTCKNAFPVVDGIPRLTPEDAVPVDRIKDQIDD